MRWGRGGESSQDTFVNGYTFPDNQDGKLKDMDMKQDNPLGAFLLTLPKHVLSLSGGRSHERPADGTTSVMFPCTATDKLGHLGQCQAFLGPSVGQPRE